MARCGDEFKPTAVEGVGRIDYFQVIASPIRVVEGGSNIGYRLTPSITGGC